MKKTEPSDIWEMIKQKEWLISHGLIILGLILLSIGLGVGLRPGVGAPLVIGIWLFSIGICAAINVTCRKPAEKKPAAKPKRK